MITKSRLYDGYADYLGKLSQQGTDNDMAAFGREISESAKLYAEISAAKGQWGCLELLESFGFEMHKVPLMTWPHHPSMGTATRVSASCDWLSSWRSCLSGCP